LAKFSSKKLQTVITFAAELGLRRSKNESCWKWGNECDGQLPEAVGPLKISKTHCLLLFFYFLLFFTHFFGF